MRKIICLLDVLFAGFVVPIVAQNNVQNASAYDFSQHRGKTIRHIASSPNGKFIFISFTDGSSIRVSATVMLKVQRFGN